MKILAVLGSARRGGNTETLIRAVLDGAGAVGAEIFALNEMRMSGCIGCMGCRVAGSSGCVVDDDMQTLYQRLMEADALILGSPVYYGEITGQMKTFMDRWYGLRDSDRKLRIPGGKKVLFVITQGADKEDWYDAVCGRLTGIAEKYGMKAEVLIGPGLGPKNAAQDDPELLERARQAGIRLASRK